MHYCQHPLSTHSVNPFYQSVLSTHSINTQSCILYFPGHPSYGLSRNMAFPLCQEYLMLRTKEAIEIVKETELDNNNNDVNFLVPEAVEKPKHMHTKRFLKRMDSKELIREAWEQEQDTLAYWGGKDYAGTTVYCDALSLARGFQDASSLYCPCLIKDTSIYNLGDVSYAEMEKQSKTLKKVKAARFGINTMIETTGLTFWKWVPKKLQRRHLFNVDVETIDLLLQYPPDPECPLNVVVWVLGVQPPPVVLKKAAKIFERQAKATDRNVLVILLAAETQVWLEEKETSTLENIADPFKGLIKVYIDAVVKAVGVDKAYPKHERFPPSRPFF